MPPHGTLQSVFQEIGFQAKRAWMGGAVAYSVGRTYHLLMRELTQVYGRYGLSASSFNLLMLLQYGTRPDEMTQQEIGKRLVVSASDMTGLIDRLERRGLVRRAPGRDRRMKLLRITPKGVGLLEEVRPHHVGAITKRCTVLGSAEAEQLVRSLAKLRRALA
jgi:DNA-binding MarR family transcriptional regulator